MGVDRLYLGETGEIGKLVLPIYMGKRGDNLLVGFGYPLGHLKP